MSAGLPPSVLNLVRKELIKLHRKPPEDIKININEADISQIEAEITGPVETPFEGGKFRVRLTLSRDFPASPPKGIFLTKIFHPNVSDKGEICVNTLKKDWKADLGIGHVLAVIRCLLIFPNPESALNEEAGRMLNENYESYRKRALLFTKIHAKPPAVDKCESSSTATRPSVLTVSSETNKLRDQDALESKSSPATKSLSSSPVAQSPVKKKSRKTHSSPEKKKRDKAKKDVKKKKSMRRL